METFPPSHRQRPVDAGHLPLQPEQVHEEEDEEGDEEPQRHHLKVLEGRPAGPTPGAVDAQEGDEQGDLRKQSQPRTLQCFNGRRNLSLVFSPSYDV